jgi:CheY-like chemotaxis protein
VSSGPFPRIFVVDDERVIAATLATILHMNGFSARFFTDPLEALAAARLDAPDLLVSDVAMPGLSGVDLALRIQAQYPECKILLFSGQAATQDLLKDARSQGHNFELLAKPVQPFVMLSRIGELAKMKNLARSGKSPRPIPQLASKGADPPEVAMHGSLKTIPGSNEARRLVLVEQRKS